MNDLIQSLIKAGAPILGTVIGGPVGTLAGAAIGALAEALGTPATPEAVQAAIEAKPDAAAIVRQVEADTAPGLVAELNARLADVQNARQQTVQLVQAGSPIAWGAPVISTLVIVGFIAALFMFLVKPVELSSAQAAILNILLGTLTAAFGQVVNYWLGSSSSSKDKDSTIRQMVQTSPVQQIATVAASVAKAVKGK